MYFGIWKYKTPASSFRFFHHHVFLFFIIIVSNLTVLLCVYTLSPIISDNMCTSYKYSLLIHINCRSLSTTLEWTIINMDRREYYLVHCCLKIWRHIKVVHPGSSSFWRHSWPTWWKKTIEIMIVQHVSVFSTAIFISINIWINW